MFGRRIVLGWIFNGRVKSMARVIHEMCSYAHHTHETLGNPIGRHFELHPMMTNHRKPAPDNRDGVHEFWLSDGKNDFSIMVYDGGPKPWLIVAPQGDFAWAHVQATAKGRYLVRLDRSFITPQGRNAAKLVKEFVSNYGALDTTA
jgi:hypothetical protein